MTTTDDTPPRTCVVIDDDPASQELMRRFLTRGGFRVIVASSGEEGLRLSCEASPSLIFLDVVLPGMNGWAVLEAVKAEPRLAGVPVVIMTILDERKKAQHLEAAGFLLKPVDRSRLTALLASLDQGASVPEAPRPVQEEPRPAAAAPAPPDANGPILLVEDDPTNRQILARLLRKQGLPVVEAGDGRTALDRVGETPPSLIILDLMLPVMDGLTFLQHLHAHPTHRHIPVVVLTAKDLSAEDRGRMGESVRKVLLKGSCKREDILGEVTRSRIAS